MIVSSHREKSKYKYNETLDKNKKNGLKTDSIVKCDEVYLIPPDYILFKIGTIDVNDYLRFINSYKVFIKESKVMVQLESENFLFFALKLRNFYFYIV